ncbi:hypothetical protein [Alteromonas sp. CYL-A6]|uniref:hypothetical protein n=1 Tax=Alteromonas nitratireducens TaxID=3390813 RepID=UPI0034C1C87D
MGARFFSLYAAPDCSCRFCLSPHHLVFAVLITLLSAGCTTVSISQSDGSVSIERHFGFVVIKPLDDASMMTAEVTSLGYSATPLGYSLGYSQQSVTTADDGCRLVVWVQDHTSQRALADKLQALEDVCVLQKQ